MIIFLSELDGTTRETTIYGMLTPEIRFPVRRAFSIQNQLPLDEPSFIVSRYRLVGVSGEIVFYDRIVDVEEIR